ncbi:hypothetical protein LPY66_02815 [Dehalobacter sp. DCM]|uniref:hypothetical protein n=1 Tax=Dehalobacter sp. DCM TaxID=2907827 RepID=UPI003081F19F|nr:hypothetical protein LPY66_02815 [Dehalobacter sp. DCM]
MNKNIKDLTGNNYGKLTVIGFAYSDKGKTYWNCYCDCDKDEPQEKRKVCVKLGKYLQDGSTSSCGCKRREHAKEISQHSNKKPRTNKPYYSQLRNIWGTLINRCHNPKYKGYKYYGAKGIFVCNEWRDNFEAFYDWAIKHSYTSGLEINRLDQSRNYMPDNCEWMPKGVSSANTCNNILMKIGNKEQSLAAWSRDPECEVCYSTIRERYHKGIKGIALIKKKKPFKDSIYTYKRKTQTFKEWSMELNISIITLRNRFKRGYKGNKLFSHN